MALATVGERARWLRWHSLDPIAALILIADDGQRHCWANDRLVDCTKWARVDLWEREQLRSGQVYACLWESDLAV